MKPSPFGYVRAHGLDEALHALAAAGDEAKPLAGGQSLIPLLAMRLAQPSTLIDLDRVSELRGIQSYDGALCIGAMTTQQQVERHPATPELIRQAVALVGHFQIRSRGTVGGSVAHADPGAEWPALVLAMDGRLTAQSAARGRRTVAAADFFLGPLSTALEPDELLVEVVLPGAGEPGAIAEVARRSGDFALVGAIAHGGRVAVFGTGSRPQRLGRVEALITEGAGGAELRAAAESEIEATDDIHASARYRRQVGATLVEEVTRRARG